MNSFIKNNQDFISKFRCKSKGKYKKKLLIEEPSIPPIDHPNAIFAMIISQAKKLQPVWLSNSLDNIEDELKFYVPDLLIQPMLRRSTIIIIKSLFISIWKYIKILLTKDILSFSYDDTKYGDFVYDTYLNRNKVATVKKIDYKFFKIILDYIYRHNDIKKILLSDNYKSVLVSHRIGLKSGVIIRVALKCNCSVYVNEGDHFVTYKKIIPSDKTSNSVFKISKKNIKNILTKSNILLGKMFEKNLKKHLRENVTNDVQQAFSNKLYISRKLFNKAYKLDNKKKNVFVMLHIFNDYPHSHFDWMIFKDYYEWFIETLKFARKNKEVNWIFKQHPSFDFYPVKNVSFKKIFSNLPKNLVYIDEKNQIDTRSLINCADLVITCSGSAGFELPAMGRIPVIIAGDSKYVNLGFTLNPKSKKEYFKFLKKAKTIQKLSLKQQKIAQATFIYIYLKSKVKITACPFLTFKQKKSIELGKKNIWYWNKVNKIYQNDKSKISKEFSCYINQISKFDLRNLNDCI